MNPALRPTAQNAAGPAVAGVPPYPTGRDPRFRELDYAIALECFGETRTRQYRTRRKRFLRRQTSKRGGNRSLRGGRGWREDRTAYLIATGRFDRLAIEEAQALAREEL